MSLFNFIKQKISILDVVSEYASLKKAGNYWKGRCPFHHEKTGSFTVSPDKEIFYCFGCHVGGDVISFIAKSENCSPLDAAKYLAKQFSIDLPEHFQLNKKNIKSSEDKNNYFNICKLVTKWCTQELKLNNNALNYVKKREFSDKVIENFSLGYFPSNGQSLKKLISFLNSESIIVKDLINMKFIIEGRKGLYSPFEDRIIFPIKDHLGKFCGFGGRVFSKDDKRPKYINSHEHEFFDKKTLLYGLDTAKKSIQTKNSVFLVEGYTDVIAMFQYGYENTVATLGTSCNERHFQQLSRYTDKAYMLYDGDIAGQNAIIKISEFCWKENIDPYVIILPNGYDPASFLQKYKSLDNLIDSAKNIYDFLIENHYKDFNSMSLSNKLSSTKKLISIVYNLQDNIKQDLLLNQISNKFGISFQILKEELSKLKPNNQVSPEPKKSLATHQIVKKINNNLNNNLQKNNPTKLRLLEKKLFLVILKNENDLDQDSKFILQKLFSHPLNKLYSEIIYIKQESNAKSISDIMSQIKNEEFKQVFSKIIIEAESYNSEESTKDLLAQFYKVKWKEIVNIMKIKINDALSKENNELAKNLLTKLDMLKKKLLKKGIS